MRDSERERGKNLGGLLKKIISRICCSTKDSGRKFKKKCKSKILGNGVWGEKKKKKDHTAPDSKVKKGAKKKR